MKNNKKHKKTNRVIFCLAVLSFIITAIHGTIYYSSYEPFFRALLVLQNSINAFGFKATVTIKDTFLFLKNSPSLFNKAVCYAYCVAIFTAPYCTISFLYKFLERLLRFIVFFRRNKNCRHVVIFGYNEDIRTILKNNISDPRNTCVHIVSAENINQEEIYSLNKEGYLFYHADVLKTNESELRPLLSKINIEKASNIILFDDSSIRNFSLLQMFCLCDTDDDQKIRLIKGAKISCRCEDEGIGRIIAEYYNRATADTANFDLELVGIPEMQIHKMYSDYPLHSIYNGSDIPLKDWNVHLLVAGFGKLGQEAVLQAINLGVVHTENKIVIDVFDKDIQSKKDVFLNRFSRETFDITDTKVCLRKEVADGLLEINFFELDITHIDFYDTIKERFLQNPYTYAAIVLKDIDLGVNCAIQLEEIFMEHNAQIPILMRMDSDRRLARYIADENGILANIKLIDDRSIVISLEMIINRTIDSIAKNYNHFYNNISLVSQETDHPMTIEDPEREWNRLKLFKRSSSKAAAYHDEVKEVVIKKLAKEKKTDLSIKLERLFGRNGILMKFNGVAWRMNGTEQQVLTAIQQDSFANDLASMEHRRWCYYMASTGWRCGKRNDRFRQNPCLITWDELIKAMPEMCKYDLMSLMARYKKIM